MSQSALFVNVHGDEIREDTKTYKSKPLHSIQYIIKMLREEMLISSYAYYELDSSYMTDDTWQRLANDLRDRQAEYGEDIGFYDEQFAEWDGSSGFQLVYPEWVKAEARRKLEIAHQR